MMASSPRLPRLLARHGARTVLCAGNGLSAEALSLACFGFDVTALDLSSVPARHIGPKVRDPDHPVHRIHRLHISDDDVITIGGDGRVDPALCRMHRGDDAVPQGGGTLALVTGDLTNPAISPGPFHVVIERRTVQLFPPEEQPSALDRLTARLGTKGLIVSQEHHGGWKPGQPRIHFAEKALRNQGFVLPGDVTDDERDAAPRLAVLMFTSG